MISGENFERLLKLYDPESAINMINHFDDMTLYVEKLEKQYKNWNKPERPNPILIGNYGYI